MKERSLTGRLCDLKEEEIEMKSRQKYQWREMTMGTCYYPEHWDQSLWREDLRRMKEAGISTVRVAEFAWSLIEPEERRFTFAFFDRFLDLCQDEGMKVIFGTPTATPPAWLSEKYPEVLNGREDGVLYRHGGRRHYNYNSSKYQELTKRIVTEIAAHYGGHPAITGWQIDNELNCEVCEFYSEADTAAFRSFLKEKYQTLALLNEAWGTVFWNQTYTQWEQIYVPRPLPGKGYNPHMQLDYFRFVSESAVRFCRLQTDIIKRYRKPGDFITTNGMFWNLDHHRMAEECLDVYTYDSYPNFAYGLERDPLAATDLKDRHWSKNLTEVRSVCPHFGIMEQQSGANGWTTQMEGPAPRPGQMALWAMQSVAHGADFISFFRWRTCTFGTEIYWHGILDYDNRDNRRLAELKAFYRNFKALDPVCGSEYQAAFGLLKDYDNEWDTNADVWHRCVASASEEAIFEASQLNHTPYDVLYLRENTRPEELCAYPVLFYPHPVIMTEERVELLNAYVEQGGTLIIGCRSGYKQENGRCVMMAQPGPLQRLTGSDVKEFTFVSRAEGPVYAEWSGVKIEMPIFIDVMEPDPGAENVRVLAVYTDSYYAGRAALMEKKTGKGRTLHLGSTFSRENVKLLLQYTGVLRPFADLIDAPEGVELAMRCRGERRFLFALNYQAEEEKVYLKKRLRSLYDKKIYEGEIRLAPYETAVWEELS